MGSGMITKAYGFEIVGRILVTFSGQEEIQFLGGGPAGRITPYQHSTRAPAHTAADGYNANAMTRKEDRCAPPEASNQPTSRRANYDHRPLRLTLLPLLPPSSSPSLPSPSSNAHDPS